MINLDKEYFDYPYYFFLRNKGNKLHLYYNVSETLTEARKKDEMMEFDKDEAEIVKKHIQGILKNKKLKNKKEVENELKKVKTKKKFDKDEMNELVDEDGTFLNSRIPNLNMALHPRKTMDQTVVATRMTNNPVTRGYRVYYGENITGEPANLKEVDYSEAYGYEETKEMDGKETYNYLVKHMGMDEKEAWERTEQFGKDPSGKRDSKSPYKNKKNFVGKLTLAEIQKNKMRDMLEDILAKRSTDEADVMKKDNKVGKILMKNIQSIKKLAEKEGIDINHLIKILKQGE